MAGGCAVDWSAINHQASQQHIPHDLLAREDMQRAILAHLSQSGFFDAGVFQGGTVLRLVYGNRRFSEDLDFVTRASVPAFVRQVSASVETLPQALARSVAYLDDVRVSTQKVNGRLRRDAFRATVSPLHKTLRINLEFMAVPSDEALVTAVTRDDDTYPVVAESLREITADNTAGAEALAGDMPRFLTADAFQQLEADIPLLLQRIAKRLPQAVAEVSGPTQGRQR